MSFLSKREALFIECVLLLRKEVGSHLNYYQVRVGCTTYHLESFDCIESHYISKVDYLYYCTYIRMYCSRHTFPFRRCGNHISSSSSSSFLPQYFFSIRYECEGEGGGKSVALFMLHTMFKRRGDCRANHSQSNSDNYCNDSTPQRKKGL